MGKTDARLHARTQAPADDMAARWERTFGVKNSDGPTRPMIFADGFYEQCMAQMDDAERDALWRRRAEGTQRERHGEGG